MNNSIMVMGKFKIQRGCWKVIKEILGLKPEEQIKFNIINKPDNYILKKDEAANLDLIITTQTNPTVLKNVFNAAGDVPVVKPFKNNKDNKQVITHLMRIEEIKIEYKYKLYEYDGAADFKNNKTHNKGNKKPYKKFNKPQVKNNDNSNQEDIKKQQEERLNEMLKNLETPNLEKPRKKRR